MVTCAHYPQDMSTHSYGNYHYSTGEVETHTYNIMINCYLADQGQTSCPLFGLALFPGLSSFHNQNSVGLGTNGLLVVDQSYGKSVITGSCHLFTLIIDWTEWDNIASIDQSKCCHLTEYNLSSRTHLSFLAPCVQGGHDALQCWGVRSTTRQQTVDHSRVCEVTKSCERRRKLRAH